MGRGSPADDRASWLRALQRVFARLGIGPGRRPRGRVWASLVRDRHVRRLLDSAADGICGVDRGGVVVLANVEALRLLGWEAEELIGRELQDVVGCGGVEGAAHARQACPIRAALATGEVQRADDEVFRRRDGTPLAVEITAAPVVEEGGIAGVLVTFRDIGARKRAERLLAESERRFRSLTEKTTDVIAIVAADGTIVYESPSAERLFGIAPEALVGRNALELIHPDDAGGVGAALESALAASGGTAAVRCRVRHREGGWRVVEALGTNLVDDPAVGGIVVNVRDLTEQVAAEAELARARARLEHVVAVSPAILFAGRLVGGRVVVEWVSANVESVVGFTAAETLEPGWWEGRLHPEDRVQAIARQGELLERGVLAHDYRVRHRDGSWRWVHDELRVVRDGADGDAEVIGSLMDITALKEMEEGLRQAQKMEAVGQLAGGIAHDFNNLLTAIRGYAKFLLQDLPEDCAQRKDVENIQRVTERAVALTQQLLAFGRRQALQPRVLELNAVVSGLGEILQRMVGEDVELVVRPAAEPLRVKADPSQLEQVILNLVVNARDAMPAGGRLEIRTSRVRVERGETLAAGRLEPGEYHALAVADTGCGIPGAVLEQIFEPFFTTKPRGKGTGLGLATVYGIVMQSGGAIRVESEPGRGTTFTVYLQAVDAGGTAPGAEAGGRTAGTVLLVEEEATVRRVTRRILEEGGYRVLEAGDGAAALGCATSHDGPIDLLLAALELPRTSGPALAESIRGVRPGIGVLFVSGYVEDPAALGAGGGGRVAYLEKPFAPEALMARVRQVIESRAEA